MKKLSTVEIRERFLKYFEKNDHLTISASSLLPQNDPTLLFINSGMAPLKNYFLGKEDPPSKRMANFQPCIRTKDIDDVGDRHHLTLFEMMGSWSIGDYYKEDACLFAYELLVDVLGFDPKKLYMTVYGGNKELGIAADTGSIEAWEKCGVAKDHIVVLGDDNFWGPAGISGPCGPCTEVFFDTGSEFGPEYKVGGHFDDVSRYIEIWNAGVFMELDKSKDGSFKELPFKSVDTGSGLERMAMVMGGYESVYETDLMAPLVLLATELYGKVDTQDDHKKIRMISDHMRAAVMILAEGVLPSNEGQGYIPRRLIRKVIAALTSVSCPKIDFTKMVEKVIELQGPFYPRMESSRDFIFYNLKTELEEFLPVITEGLKKIEEEVQMNHKTSDVLFSGKVASNLVTTFGLPLEVIKSDLETRGIVLDIQAYEKFNEEHKKTSRVISRKDGVVTDTDKIADLLKSSKATVFSGYEKESNTSHIEKIISSNIDVKNMSNIGEVFYLTTTQTSFYGESGGQSGDIGIIKNQNTQIKVLDTLKISGIHVHLCELKSGSISVDDEVELIVDSKIRISIARNHTATHLLHAALHKIIGKHAVQKGSSVRANNLRFDFVHQKGLTPKELLEVEREVNFQILAGIKGETNVLSYDDALKKGAMALFGEKYESDVRVVSFDSHSVELCGGTHISNTAQIGSFIIKSEGSVAKGIRRIEAVTGEEAYNLQVQRSGYLRDLSLTLGSKPEQLNEKVKELIKKAKPAKKVVKELSSSDVKFIDSFSKSPTADISFFMGSIDAEAEQIKSIGDQMLDKGDFNMICLLGVAADNLKCFMWVKKEFSKSYKAGDVLKKILEPVGGKGGGKPHFAQGGAPDSKSSNELISSFKTIIDKYLGQK